MFTQLIEQLNARLIESAMTSLFAKPHEAIKLRRIPLAINEQLI
jgi:hypothetical protein